MSQLASTLSPSHPLSSVIWNTIPLSVRDVFVCAMYTAVYSVGVCVCVCMYVCVCVWQDREQTLAAIDSLLSQQPITSEHLAKFILQHPDVVRQQGIKDDLSLTTDSEQLSDSVLCDSVSLSVADSADTSSNMEHVSCTTVTRRHYSHRSLSLCCRHTS